MFRQHNLRFELKAGDLIFFRSRELLHENLDARGQRMSIVFTMDHNAFLSPGQKVSRQYLSKPHLAIDRDADDSEEEPNEDIHFANTSDDEVANEDYAPNSSWKIKKRRNKIKAKIENSNAEIKSRLHLAKGTRPRRRRPVK